LNPTILLRNNSSKNRNNLLLKLAGSKEHMPTICGNLHRLFAILWRNAPVCFHSTHTNLVDVQLNNSMRLISGTFRPSGR